MCLQWNCDTLGQSVKNDCEVINAYGSDFDIQVSKLKKMASVINCLEFKNSCIRIPTLSLRSSVFIQ